MVSGHTPEDLIACLPHPSQSAFRAFRNYDLAFHSTNGRYFKWCAVGDAAEKTFIARAVSVLGDLDDVVLVHSKTDLIGDARDNGDRYTVELNLIDEDPTVRYRKYLGNVRLNNVMNGLIRRNSLEKTCLNKGFHASDKCMIAELALRGKFVELSDPLLFRRMESATATAVRSPMRKGKNSSPPSRNRQPCCGTGRVS